MSASLCADAYVLALTEREDIAALSWQVDQPVSAAPGWARQMPRAWPDAERLMRLNPAITVFGAGEGGRAASFLERAGLASVELAWAEDFDGVRRNYRLIGERLGRSDAADAAIADLDHRLQALVERTERRGRVSNVVYLSSSGGSAGTGTYVDAAITAAGGVNVMAQAGAAGWTRSDPELALGLDADLVVTSFFRDGYQSTFNRALRHAAYRHLLVTDARLDVPSGDWPCAGPRLIEAAEAIADALDALEDGS